MAAFLPFSRTAMSSTRQLLLSRARRPFSSSKTYRVADDKMNPFSGGPAPPRLPKEEQEIFEELQRQSTGAFSTPRAPPKVNQSPDSQSQGAAAISSSSAQVEASSQEEEFHPNMRQGAKPEFEGEKNPKTGEIGGPKNEPLRWGHDGDWSYNGRVTDF